MRTEINRLAVVIAITALALSGTPAFAQGSEAQAAISAAAAKAAEDDKHLSAGDYDSAAAVQARALLEMSRAPTRVTAADTDRAARAREIAQSVTAQNAVPCTLADTRYMFAGNAAYQGAQITSDFVEAACANGLGYVLIKHRGKATSQALDCIQAGLNPQTKCALPANARPELALTAHLGARAATCAPTAAKASGETTLGRLYEVRCAQGDGLLVIAPKHGSTAAAPAALTCFSRIGTPDACTLTTADQSRAAVVALMAQSGKTCATTGQRYMAGRQGGGGYYEFACGSAPGLVLLTKSDGAVEMTATCAQAANIAGGCKLSTAVQ